MEKSRGGLMIIKENCEQRGWCHMPSSRKVEKRIKEWGEKSFGSLSFSSQEDWFLERRRTG